MGWLNDQPGDSLVRPYIPTGIVSGVIASGQVGRFHIASGSVGLGSMGHGSVVSGAITSGSMGLGNVRNTYDATSMIVGIQYRDKVDWLSNICGAKSLSSR